ncbi:hypothetical protein ADL22_27095 [Streptomyces sp. NRRL F-4489]|nr:hypothetical protein ADL22_27095 [Streptomyces sp. NRRL F-4489]
MKLSFQDTLDTTYVRQDTESDAGGADSSSLPSDPYYFYYVNLAASRRSPGSGPAAAENIKVTVDFSAAKAVTFHTANVNRDLGCKRSGALLTCAPKNIKVGWDAKLRLFTMSPWSKAPKGPAGHIDVTVSSTNAPTIHHTTQVVIGTPFVTARVTRGRGGVAPGSDVAVTPAFRNEGDTGIQGDLNVVVDVTGQATLRRQYRNCRYDKADAPTKAVCTLPGPLPAGTAYETDRPFTATTTPTGRQGLITYSLYPARDTPVRAQLPDSAPRGTGPALGFRPADGGDYSPYSRAGHSSGTFRFITTRTYDMQADAFTIKGAVGEEISLDVVDVDGFSDGVKQFTLPEGVVVEGHREGESGDLLFCEYSDRASRKVSCPGSTSIDPVLRVRIAKRVEGAKGSVYVEPDPRHPDPDLTNNTAPITVEYTD